MTKTVSVEEIIDSGILQEANRRFFHPLGLALAITFPGGKMELLDARDDPEGFIFDSISKSKLERFVRFMAERKNSRLESLGYIVQSSESLPDSDGAPTEDSAK